MKSPKFNFIYRRLISIFHGSLAKKSSLCSTECCDKESVAIEHKNSIIPELPDDLVIEQNEYETLVCTLTESKLVDRKKELYEEVFSNVKKTKEVDTGFIFSFDYDERFLMMLTKYIITEKRCCPFFNFDIKLYQSNDILLKITGPIEAKEMLRMFLDEGNGKSLPSSHSNRNKDIN